MEVLRYPSFVFPGKGDICRRIFLGFAEDSLPQHRRMVALLHEEDDVPLGEGGGRRPSRHHPWAHGHLSRGLAGVDLGAFWVWLKNKELGLHGV